MKALDIIKKNRKLAIRTDPVAPFEKLRQSQSDYSIDITPAGAEARNHGAIMMAKARGGSQRRIPSEFSTGAFLFRVPTTAELDMGSSPSDYVLMTDISQKSLFQGKPMERATPFGGVSESATMDVAQGVSPSDSDPMYGSPVVMCGDALSDVINRFSSGVIKMKDKVKERLSKTDLSDDSKKVLGLGALTAASVYGAKKISNSPFWKYKALDSIFGDGNRRDYALPYNSVGGSVAMDAFANQMEDGAIGPETLTALSALRGGPVQYSVDSLQPAPVGGELIYFVPNSFWEAAYDLGCQYEREKSIPTFGYLAGNPVDVCRMLAGVRAPQVYVTEEGKSLKTAVPYVAGLLDTGVLEEMARTVESMSDPDDSAAILSLVTTPLQGGIWGEVASAGMQIAGQLASSALQGITSFLSSALGKAKAWFKKITSPHTWTAGALIAPFATKIAGVLYALAEAGKIDAAAIQPILTNYQKGYEAALNAWDKKFPANSTSVEKAKGVLRDMVMSAQELLDECGVVLNKRDGTPCRLDDGLEDSWEGVTNCDTSGGHGITYFANALVPTLSASVDTLTQQPSNDIYDAFGTRSPIFYCTETDLRAAGKSASKAVQAVASKYFDDLAAQQKANGGGSGSEAGGSAGGGEGANSEASSLAADVKEMLRAWKDDATQQKKSPVVVPESWLRSADGLPSSQDARIRMAAEVEKGLKGDPAGALKAGSAVVSTAAKSNLGLTISKWVGKLKAAGGSVASSARAGGWAKAMMKVVSIPKKLAGKLRTFCVKNPKLAAAIAFVGSALAIGEGSVIRSNKEQIESLKRVLESLRLMGYLSDDQCSNWTSLLDQMIDAYGNSFEGHTAKIDLTDEQVCDLQALFAAIALALRDMSMTDAGAATIAGNDDLHRWWAKINMYQDQIFPDLAAEDREELTKALETEFEQVAESAPTEAAPVANSISALPASQAAILATASASTAASKADMEAAAKAADPEAAGAGGSSLGSEIVHQASLVPEGSKAMAWADENNDSVAEVAYDCLATDIDGLSASEASNTLVNKAKELLAAKGVPAAIAASLAAIIAAAILARKGRAGEASSIGSTASFAWEQLLNSDRSIPNPTVMGVSM